MITFTTKENRFMGQMMNSASGKNAFITIYMFYDIFQIVKVALDC